MGSQKKNVSSGRCEQLAVIVDPEFSESDMGTYTVSALMLFVIYSLPVRKRGKLTHGNVS